MLKKHMLFFFSLPEAAFMEMDENIIFHPVCCVLQVQRVCVNPLKCCIGSLILSILGVERVFLFR